MNQIYCFGADVGGTSVKLGLFTNDGALLENWEINTRKEEYGRYILEDVGKAILSKMQERKILKEQVAGIGLGVPGPVKEDGTVNGCVNLGWGVFNVANALSEITGLLVVAANDANAAALGELWQGGGKGFESVVMVTLGTGVGGGIVINRKIVTGADGAAGEFGHMTVNLDETEICTCGKKGCLEQFASATGIVRVAKKKCNEFNANSVLKQEEEITAKSVLDGAKIGDELCLQIMNIVGEYLGISLGCVGTVINPSAFVIGGGVSKAGEFLIELLEKKYRKFAFHASIDTAFRLAALGNNAGIYGCAKMILG